MQLSAKQIPIAGLLANAEKYKTSLTMTVNRILRLETIKLKEVCENECKGEYEAILNYYNTWPHDSNGDGNIDNPNPDPYVDESKFPPKVPEKSKKVQILKEKLDKREAYYSSLLSTYSASVQALVHPLGKHGGSVPDSMLVLGDETNNKISKFHTDRELFKYVLEVYQVHKKNYPKPWNQIIVGPVVTSMTGYTIRNGVKTPLYRLKFQFDSKNTCIIQTIHPSD